VLTQWITKHVQGVGYLITEEGQIALFLYFVLIFPGILIHELSHALAAWLLRVKVRHLSIGIRRKGQGKRVALGSVDVASTDPIRASLIGLAPLISGCAAILIISNQVFGLRPLTAFSVPRLWQELQSAYGVPDFWLWIYLVFAIGNAMLPSAADRRSWGVALLFLAFVGALVYFSGLFDMISYELGRWARSAVTQLSYAFATAVLIDLVFAAVLFATEQALALLGFGRLQYR
jgi:hypothetical protein